MKKRILLFLLLLILLVLSLIACSGGGAPAEPTKSSISPGTVKLNPHPTSLDGKTVLLRWNSKPNGDKLLTQIGNLIAAKAKDVKIIKLWETDPSTAKISENVEQSNALADKIAALKPDLVIASQGD